MCGGFKDKKTIPMTSRTTLLSSTFDMSCVFLPRKMFDYTNCCVVNLNISSTKSATFWPMKSITVHSCSQGILDICQQ